MAREVTEAELWRRWRSGDVGARNAIVLRYMPVVKSTARRFKVSPELRDDLEGAGAVGLMRAVELYDPNRGPAFGSSASAWVLGAMKKELARHLKHASGGDPTWEDIPDLGPEPSQVVITRDLRGAVESGLSDIPEQAARRVRTYLDGGERGVSPSNFAPVARAALSQVRASLEIRHIEVMEPAPAIENTVKTRLSSRPGYRKLWNFRIDDATDAMIHELAKRCDNASEAVRAAIAEKYARECGQ